MDAEERTGRGTRAPDAAVDPEPPEGTPDAPGSGAESEAPGEPAAAGPAGPRSPPRPSAEHAVRLAELLRVLEDAERITVLTHDNPDPDAIASAAGMAFLLERTTGASCRVAFGGIVGRAENRALMEELGVRFERVEGIDLAPEVVVLVDTQPRAGNNSLPAGSLARAVVDHHPLRGETAAASFSDVRPEYGSCCTILVEYIRVAKLEPDRRLATALFYGIQSETMDLGREASPPDVSASLYLYPRSDPAAISRIRHARVPRSLFRSIHDGLERAWRRGGVVCVPAGRMEYPDMVAQLADLFLRVEGVDWVVAAGRHHDALLLSVRAFAPTAHAGGLVQEVVGDRGPAGGHGTMAGARIDARRLDEEEYAELVEELLEGFCAALEVDGEERRPLLEKVSGGSEEPE